MLSNIKILPRFLFNNKNISVNYKFLGINNKA